MLFEMDKERDRENRSESEIRNLFESGNVTPRAKKQFSWLVMTLIVINWILFILSLYKNNCPAKRGAKQCLLSNILGRFSFERTDRNTQLGPSAATLRDMGGLKWKPRDKDIKRWHIFSSIFLHSGLASLIFNTISLLYQAIELEQTFGVVRIGLLYYLSGLGGSLWCLYKFNMAVYVGASAAVSGLSGAAFSDLIINWESNERKFKKFVHAVLGVGINLVIGLIPGVELSAYYGGLLAGFLQGFLFLIRKQVEQAGVEHVRDGYTPKQLINKYTGYQCVLWFIVLVVSVIGFAWIFDYIVIKIGRTGPVEPETW